VVPLQQPPLHGDVLLQVVEHTPPMQALPAKQSASVLQPHFPLERHAEPFRPEQSVQVPPAGPQITGVVPAWHTLPVQQLFLQIRPPAQLGLHLPPLHALPPGQSAEVLQPHAPATHALPFALPVQSVQADAEPHAVVDAGVHLPIEPPQQKPALQPPPSQLAVQAPPTHVGVTPVHGMHAPPAEPHCVSELPGTHFVPSQQPPLHLRFPAQLVPHRPVAGSQASPFAQLVDVHGACVSEV
jgi:hypothetical protein